MKHGTKTLEENPNNFPPYRWHGECLCGFTTRVATEEAAASQLTNHFATHKHQVEPDDRVFKRVEEVPQVVEVEEVKKEEGTKEFPKIDWGKVKEKES